MDAKSGFVVVQRLLVQNNEVSFRWECADECTKLAMEEVVEGEASFAANWHDVGQFFRSFSEILRKEFDIGSADEYGARIRILTKEERQQRGRDALLARIRERRERLAEVSAKLKKHFVGIDHVIDHVIRDIEIWYVMPELMTRPCIVCLWGMTGVGKTDLVRKLTKHLGFLDRYVETQLATDNRSWRTNVSEILSSSSIECGEPGILLLDEVQRFRTVDENGNEIRNNNFSDVWSLLSDGSFAADWDLKRDLHEMLQELGWRKIQKEKEENSNVEQPRESARRVAEGQQADRGLEKLENEVAEAMSEILNGQTEDFDAEIESVEAEELAKDLPEVTHAEFVGTEGKTYKSVAELIAAATPGTDPEEPAEDDEYGVEVSLDKDGKVSYGRLAQMSSWEARRFKSKLNLPHSLGEIMSWSLDKRMDVLVERMNDPSTYEGRDYSQLLVFVSGNLDEAFTQSIAVGNADISADFAHIQSLHVDVATIKSALTKRFKPEQIARLGNNHVIYPSLSKSSYEEIIRRKLAESADTIREMHSISIAADQSVADMVYTNGVFPLQGTRPVFTTLSAIVGLAFPRAVLLALENGMSGADVSYDKEGKKFVCRAGNDSMEISYEGDLDLLREKNRSNLDCRREISVHEAGHAVAHAILNGIAPIQVSVATIDGGGFTNCHDFGSSPQGVMCSIVVGIAGTVAEEIVFGVKNSGRGNRHDIQQTTSRLGELVRRSGIVPGFPAMACSSDQAQLFDNDVERADEPIRQLMNTARDFTKRMLLAHIDVLVDVADALYRQPEVTAEQFVEICGERLPIATLDPDEPLQFNYNEIYEKFVAERLQALLENRQECDENLSNCLYELFCRNLDNNAADESVEEAASDALLASRRP